MVPHTYVEVCRIARFEETHFESSVGGEECLVSGESKVSGDRIGGGRDMDADEEEEEEGREGAEERNHEKSLEEREMKRDHMKSMCFVRKSYKSLCVYGRVRLSMAN